MFRRHYYKFEGKTFHQSGGGPIGLRGTCAVARLIMQLFDRRWGEILREMGVEVWCSVRYMDDVRTALPPFKPGWRWVDQGIKYCKKWEREDSTVTAIERTRRVLAGSMGIVEDFLEFTTENRPPTIQTRVDVGGPGD